MADQDRDEIAIPQREVQRLLGRCLIRLQQYERLLKAVIAFQEISGTAQTLPHAIDARRAEASGKTLGTLIGRLFGGYIVPDGDEPSSELEDPTDDSIRFSLRTRLSLPQDHYETLKADLRELVTLRNTLVHHFIDQHDLWTVDGCLQAQDALKRTYAEVDRHFEQLRTFAEHMDQAKQAAAELIRAPEFQNMLCNGIGPDGTIHWPLAGIVSGLRQALQELAADGWTNLDAAARWMSENHPEQTPQKYGCARWRQVIHESGQFELRRMTHNGQFGAWFRARPTSDG